MILKGKVWKFGDEIDTDIIIPARHLVLPLEEMKHKAMEPLRPTFAAEVADGDVIGDWSAYYDGGDTVPGDGDWHGVKLCVKAWKTKIYKAAPGDEVSVGSVDITVMPDV